MSGSIIKGLTSDRAVLGDFSKHDLYGGIWAPIHVQSNAGTLPMITHIGNWCMYDANKFCQESRCSDCIICEEHK